MAKEKKKNTLFEWAVIVVLGGAVAIFVANMERTEPAPSTASEMAADKKADAAKLAKKQLKRHETNAEAECFRVVKGRAKYPDLAEMKSTRGGYNKSDRNEYIVHVNAHYKNAMGGTIPHQGQCIYDAKSWRLKDINVYEKAF